MTIIIMGAVENYRRWTLAKMRVHVGIVYRDLTEQYQIGGFTRAEYDRAIASIQADFNRAHMDTPDTERFWIEAYVNDWNHIEVLFYVHDI